MEIARRVLLTAAVASIAFAQQPASPAPAKPTDSKSASSLSTLLESKVKAEWDAFKNKDKKAYGDLLADDFIAIEDDGQGTRTKNAAVAEAEKSVVSKYYLFAFRVLPLNPNAALVTYELTMEFFPGAQMRFKRVLVSEVWLQQNGQWKERYYQETRTR
jgi:hypothetical protein